MRIAGVAFALFQILSVTSLFGSCSFPPIEGPHATAVVYNPNTASFSSFPASIFLDGKFVCRIPPGSYVIIPLVPGPHSVRGNEKIGSTDQNFESGVTYYYKASTYIHKEVLVYTSLALALKHDLEYDLSGLKPAKGETKPLPEPLQLTSNVLTPSNDRVDVTVIETLPLNTAYNWYAASATK